MQSFETAFTQLNFNEVPTTLGHPVKRSYHLSSSVWMWSMFSHVCLFVHNCWRTYIQCKKWIENSFFPLETKRTLRLLDNLRSFDVSAPGNTALKAVWAATEVIFTQNCGIEEAMSQRYFLAKFVMAAATRPRPGLFRRKLSPSPRAESAEIYAYIATSIDIYITMRLPTHRNANHHPTFWRYIQIGWETRMKITNYSWFSSCDWVVFKL